MWSIDTGILMLTVALSLSIYLERSLPLLLLSSSSLSDGVVRWLDFVAPAILAAILLPAVLLIKQPDGEYEMVFGFDNAMLWATIPAFVLAFKGSYFGTIAVGMISTALIRYFAS
ncbi:MAG: AzlD domain-containing protein [Desulfovibrionaceae bacterium]|nr:AzlD domain-containing protein [Desulfovibrionaceae bacterium]